MKDNDNLFSWKDEKDNENYIHDSETPLCSTRKKREQNLHLRQAILVWLAKQNPTGIGVNVPTRFIKYQADVAAFWSYPLKRRIYAPYKVALIEICQERENCWPDFSKQSALLKELVSLKEEKRKLEERIKIEEPHLKDAEVLFNEYGLWHFQNSKNKDYHKCIKKIEKLEHFIYKGSRLERIRQAHVADNLYLAAPQGLIHPDELIDGWGLLYVSNDYSVEVVKEPEDKECKDENRMHIAQTISASAARIVLFSQGVNISHDGKIFISRPPHRRHKTSATIFI
ncbi:MAG TPA: hypothetical protein P5270_00040 [Victivallales bacterium]|nr:hypothetical protein [Victivallales bacterium]HPO90201.1 hypothetical protein [Victivallales bacterium]HRR27730.1 hypothetical protein [Victivallales bacterium]HRU00259.1 hypothetical protein [Victivallales bacterium]